MTSAPGRAPLILFGVVAVYIVLQFTWWAWLLLAKDGDVESLQQQLLREGVAPVVAVHAPGSTRWMVLGEGGVFMALVLVALWLTYRSVKQEWALARQQRDFLLAASHELRTPLAGLKLHLQTARRPGIGPEQREGLLDTGLAEIDRLHKLAEKILLATRLEQERPAIRPEEQDPGPLVRAVVERAGATYGAAHHIETSLPAGLRTKVDGEAFRSVVENLVENACKYAQPGTTVQVGMVDMGATVELRVEDRGPGVPPAERSAIFRKFHRAGNEETRSTKGTGLGLFIVQRLVEAHGGRIECLPRPGGGAIFTASFPKR
jgi:signal transduction histidine kinase